MPGMREARSWRLALLRAQAGREKRDTDEAASDAATETEQRVLGLMADALSAVPRTPASEPPPQPDPIAEAEQYALHHRKRAILIRRLGRVPQKPVPVSALAAIKSSHLPEELLTPRPNVSSDAA
jgi:hypothetical protein